MQKGIQFFQAGAIFQMTAKICNQADPPRRVRSHTEKDAAGFFQAGQLRRFAWGTTCVPISIGIVLYSDFPSGWPVQSENRTTPEFKAMSGELGIVNRAVGPKKVASKKVGQWRRRMQNVILHLSVH